MKNTFKGKAGRWLVVYGLLLLMGITSVGFVQAASLTDDEIYWLTYMREEEKLARDVYTQFCDLYGHRTFCNIKLSEQTHMDAVKTLLVRYGVPDPVTNDTVGAFTDKFKDLYSELISGGSVSLTDAFKVGVFIEETDIDDLDKAILATGSRYRDIIKVYNNLKLGSENHLTAFCSNLQKLGITSCEPYVPEP